MSTWIVIAIAAGALALLAWPFYLKPYLMPMEGLEKLVFVIWAGGSGVCLLGMAPSVYYSLLCALLGLLLLAAASWPSWRTYRRWRRDRVLFQLSSRTIPAARPSQLEDDRAA